MTESSFQSEVLSSLGSLARESSETRAAIAAIGVNQKHVIARLEKLEKRDSDRIRCALETGEHRVEELEAMLASRAKAIIDASNSKRTRWWDLGSKAALIVIGSIIATFVPAIAKAIGL